MLRNCTREYTSHARKVSATGRRRSTVNTVTMTDDLPGRLLAVLRTATGNPRLSFPAPPEPLTGGFWAELLAFRLARAPAGFDGDLVAPGMPDPALARKETLVQAEVARR